MNISERFAITLYAARLTPAQREVSNTTRKLMEWCASAAQKDLSVRFRCEDVMAYLGCSERTTRRAIAEAKKTGWLVNAKSNGRAIVGMLGEMYGTQAQGEIPIAAQVYQKAFGIRLNKEVVGQIAETVGESEDKLKLLNQACRVARTRGIRFRDADGVLKIYRGMLVLGSSGTGQHKAPATSEQDGRTLNWEW